LKDETFCEFHLNSSSKQIKDITRQVKKAVVAGSLRELQRKSAEKFSRPELPKIHLDSDGTEIDDEDYFQTLEPNTELICVFNGEQWIDVSEREKLFNYYKHKLTFKTAHTIHYHHHP
jgi:hypothetical protein